VRLVVALVALLVLAVVVLAWFVLVGAGGMDRHPPRR
jgi:hypothetical protein